MLVWLPYAITRNNKKGNKMEKLEVYQVIGTSFRNKFKSTGFWSDGKGALKEFVKENPRFHGTIKLRKQLADKMDQVIIADALGWTLVEQFEKSKEILDWHLFEGDVKK